MSSKRDIMIMMTNIPTIISTLQERRVEGIDDLVDTWERYKTEGAVGKHIKDLYGRLKNKLPEEEKTNYL